MNAPDRTRQVLFITYEFPPSLEMGAQASIQLARYLPLYAWEPVVLTVQERYFPNKDDRFRREFPGPVLRTRVIPHPLNLYGSVKSALRFNANGGPDTQDAGRPIGTLRRWILSLLRTPDVYTGWIVPAIVTGLRAIRRHRVTHLCSSAPYWSNHLIGLVLSQLTGLTWTAHFRDPWTGIPQWKPESAVSERIEIALERMVVRRASSVVCVTDLHAGLFRKVYPGLPAGKFVTVPNGFDEAEWREVGAGTDNLVASEPDRFMLRYTGTFYQKRNPLPLFRALRALLDSGEIDQKNFTIDLVGWCDVAEDRRVREMVEECGVADCVTFTGPLSRPETLRQIAQADLLLLLAEAQPYQIPGKTYEYLRAGRPILALTSNGALSDLLRKTGGAWVVNPGDHVGIVAALQEAYGRWRRRQASPGADRSIVGTFDRRLLAGQLAKLFDDACRRPDKAVLRRPPSYRTTN